MTRKEKRDVLRKVRDRFESRQPLLENTLRQWGVATLDEAQELMGEFIDNEYQSGSVWTVEWRPYECEAINPRTGKPHKDVVMAFWGKLRGKFDRRKTLAALNDLLEETCE